MRTEQEWQAALDLEARLRETMALAFDRASADLKAAEETLKARDAFLRKLKAAIESGEACDETVWIDHHTTAVDGIAALLDDPKARGERPLLDLAS